jgi:hypothetical protein
MAKPNRLTLNTVAEAGERVMTPSGAPSYEAGWISVSVGRPQKEGGNGKDNAHADLRYAYEVYREGY